MIKDVIAIFLATVSIGLIYAFEDPAGVGAAVGTLYRAFSTAACGG